MLKAFMQWDQCLQGFEAFVEGGFLRGHLLVGQFKRDAP